MIKHLLLLLVFFSCFHEVNAQEIGEIKEVTLILADIPFSGEDYQPNFMDSDTNEVISFNRTTWLDKHVSLFDFFQTYRDSCLENTLYFHLTMIYLPIEDETYLRNEGFIPTGKMVNTWVLTSILSEEESK